MDELNDMFTRQKSSFDLLFSEPEELTYLEIDLGFKPDPGHLLRWLEAAHSNLPFDDDFHITGVYSQDVACECEFSCLYLAMLLRDKKFDKEPVIYSGNFGFWDHYWTAFFIGKQEYFVDMTLAQFRPEAPKVAVTKAKNTETGYRWYPDIFPYSFSYYLDMQDAFRFYPDPLNIV